MLSAVGLSFVYPGAAAPAFSDVNLSLSPGELVLLSGPTGCGKSTLLRVLAGLLPRFRPGRRQGTLSLNGDDPAALAPSTRARRLAFVSQVPGDQIVTHSIGEEVAFAARLAGLPDLDATVHRLLAAVGLPLSPDRSPQALSGGQQQRLAVAAALSAGAPLLLLDEPLSYLDPAGARALMQRLRQLCDQGLAALLVEHRVGLAAPYAHRQLFMSAGRLLSTPTPSPPSGAAPETFAQVDPTSLSPHPLPPAILPHLGGKCPKGAEGDEPSPLPSPTRTPQARHNDASPLLRLRRARHRHGPGGDRPWAVQDVDLDLFPGERVALVGANGAGKSGLLQLLATEARRQRLSTVAIPQDPDLALYCDTVWEELLDGPTERRRPDPVAAAAAALAALDLEALRDQPPQSLSRGQRLRVAVASALSAGPRLLLLDEPTAGQDGPQVDRMMAALDAALGDAALVFATHDLALARSQASRILLLREGRVVADGPPDALALAIAADPDLGGGP